MLCMVLFHVEEWRMIRISSTYTIREAKETYECDRLLISSVMIKKTRSYAESTAEFASVKMKEISSRAACHKMSITSFNGNKNGCGRRGRHI